MPVSEISKKSPFLAPAPAPYPLPSLVVEHSKHGDVSPPLSIPNRVVIFQEPISVTLDGLAIFSLSLGLVFILHFVDLFFVKVLVSLVPVVLVIDNDYRNFLNLGPGGTPSTVFGYVKICYLRLISVRDPYTPPKADPDAFPRQGAITRKAGPLPYRSGPRPHVVGIAPQRQLDQHGSQKCNLALRRALENLGREKPLKFATSRSFIEKHGIALFAKHPPETNCQGEICHVHDLDHSMHLFLHPEDSKEILQKGWGQRHPLSQEKSFPIKMPVSPDFVMIYTPRDDHELQIIYRIISAAIWYVLAEEVELKAS